jgi:hypothetical protein
VAVFVASANQQAQEVRAMLAEYNWIIDSKPIRFAINAAAIAVWLGAAFGLMFFAAQG